MSDDAGPAGRCSIDDLHDSSAGRAPRRLGGALGRAWVGYRRLLDVEMAAAGFGDRRFPDGRVLRICIDAGDATISHIARELGITRQGASKIVAGLVDRNYVTLHPSPTDGREKIVQLTPRANEYLATMRRAAKRIEQRLRDELGDDAFSALQRLLDVLGGDEQPRLSEYMKRVRGGRGDPMFGHD